MCTVDGMSASNVVRSECGADIGCRVGSAWVIGWMADVVVCSTTSYDCGAGRVRGVFASSISTSVVSMWRLRVMFLVLGAISNLPVLTRQNVKKQK
jgi:hypothetical protein